jgi:hypothetical protein
MVPNSLVAASPVLSGSAAPVEITDELIAAYKQVAEEEVRYPVAPAAESEPACRHEGGLERPLGDAVTHLYELARHLEAEGNYARADQILDLARSIRGEIDILRRTEAPTSLTASAPISEASLPATPATTSPTVTEAPPFIPEPPAP